MIDLTVKTLDSQNHAFSLEDDQITVRGFKEYIAESVAVPADSQRLIYCGRVLQDEKKLNDYDVNGKVIHLVQRAPPQPGQRGNDGGQSQGQNHGSHGWQNPQRTHYRLTRAQMHGNAMYLGAMSVPAEIVEGHGLALPQFSNTLSNGRLIVARHMVERTNRLMDRLENPSRPVNLAASENNRPALGELMQESELEPEQFVFSNIEGRTNNGAILAEAAAAAAIVAALSAAGANNVTPLRAGSSDETAEARPTTEAAEENQTDSQQPQAEQQGSTSNTDGQSNRRASPQLPRPPQLAELLEMLQDTQARLRPVLDRYCKLMRDDPSLPPGGRVEENQAYVDGANECLHYMSHACHALSDIIVDMSQQPPRNLRCRPIIIQHSAILQPGIPIQVEAHISLHGRNANNNNGNEESGDSTNNASQPESAESNAEDSSQQPEPESAAHQQAEQPQQQPQEQAQSSFGTVFNLPNNVEVLMEVSPESNMDAASGSEQTQTGENNNNNNNNNVGGRVGGTAGGFSWGSAPAPDFIRNLMQAVAGHMVQSGMTNTTITSRNPVTVGQQNVTTMDSGNTNAGQSTQARSNVGTHPTTATQTRSTSRPHVFHQQAHPLGVGMSIGQAFDFDPFLPCNSHHVRRTSTTSSNTVTSTSQSTQTSQTATSETQSQAQTATTSSATSNTSSTNTTASTTSQTNTNDPFMFLPQQILGGRSGQPQASISINSNNPDLAESLGNILQLFSGRNIHVGIVGDSGNTTGSDVTFADLLEHAGIQMNLLSSQDSESEGDLLLDLAVLVVQNLTLEGIIRLRTGQWEPISHLRRPLQEFLQYSFPNTSTEALQEQAAERLLSQLRPLFQNLFASEEEVNIRNGSRIDICATVEALLRRHIKDILQFLFNNDIDDARFGQEIFNIVNNLGRQLCAVLRYSIRGGQSGLEVIVSRFMTDMLEGTRPEFHRWLPNIFVAQLRTYSSRVSQPPESEILPLLVYKDVPSQPSTVPSAPIHQPSQTQSEVEPMETEAIEERTTFEASLPDDGGEVPETFPGHEALPSDWVPIIARDGVRQRRQLQMQGMTNGGVATFSDAYLGTLPTKRRKLIEQQKPRLLVSPTPNHSAIAASMERLVREGVTRAGVEEVEGAAVAVAVDPGVRRAFGQAIRDCLNPRRYGTPDFPDPIRFPNATKYFSDQDRPPK
ncbi:large proline-rich protein BAG6 isoform X1 [Osmia bicornis bicornis]|uniref:large proline-rich protein BAG6 isoform X1 n=1 Tax=Osmia bicornis bicornis TaxID=1437191 RepID=UPI001EAF51F3|nr:large proline-rich protein BAG6 isoform X1 [Osmia bicornis bicornis]XP_029055125.2 large proline-rich protein BAG6 isoform X1 [Osmia bicornis bicornis]